MPQLDYDPFRLANLALDELRTPPGSYFAQPFVRYLLALAECVAIKTIVIGQEPYGRQIYPFFGAAFAYDTSLVPDGVTPSVAIFREYMKFIDKAFDAIRGRTLVEALANSFKLLHRGYVFINASVGTFTDSSSVARHIIETAAFLRNLTFSRKGWENFKIEVICFGSLAQELGNLYANSVNKDIKVSVIRTVHPAYLARLPLARRRKLTYFGNMGVAKILKDITLNYVAVQREMTTFSFDDLSRCLRNVQLQLEVRAAAVKAHLQESQESLQGMASDASPAVQSLARALGSTNQAIAENESLVSVFGDAVGTVLYVLGSKAVSATTSTTAPLTVSQTRPREVRQASLSGPLAWPKGSFEPDSEDEEEHKSESESESEPSDNARAVEPTAAPTKPAGDSKIKRPLNLVTSDSESDSAGEPVVKPSASSKSRVASGATLVLNSGLLDEPPHSVYAGSDSGIHAVETPPITPRLPLNLVMDSESSGDENSKSGGESDYESDGEVVDRTAPSTPTATMPASSVVVKTVAITALIVLNRKFRSDPRALSAVPCRYQLIEDLAKSLPTNYNKSEDVTIGLVPELSELREFLRALEESDNIKEIVTSRSHPFLTRLHNILTTP